MEYEDQSCLSSGEELSVASSSHTNSSISSGLQVVSQVTQPPKRARGECGQIVILAKLVSYEA